MRRIAVLTASAAAVVAATMALAQPQPVPPAGGSGPDHMQGREDRRADRQEGRAERMKARLDERLTRLRADMKLTPDQAPLFDRVEALIRKNAEERAARFASMRESRGGFRDADIMERLDMIAGRQAENAARSKDMADAVRPLWSTLSDPQKTVARRAVREAMAEGRGMMRGMRGRMEERRGGWRDDHEHGPRRWRDDWRGDRGDRRG